VPDLSFTVEGAKTVRFAASPQLALELRVANAPAGESIQAVVLRCQVQIDAPNRHYSDEEQAGLRDLFGAPERWGQTLRTVLWTQSTVTIPAFTDHVTVDVALPCGYDFNLATTKLFHALREGEIPLTLLFSGTVFYAGADDTLQVAQIPWSKETHYRLPVRVWKDTMDLYYPNSLFVPLRKDVFERLYGHKVRLGLPTWEQTVERLLERAGETR